MIVEIALVFGLLCGFFIGIGVAVCIIERPLSSKQKENSLKDGGTWVD